MRAAAGSAVAACTGCRAAGSRLGRGAAIMMPEQGLPVSSERAGGEIRRSGPRRKAAENTLSAAEDFAFLTTHSTQTVSARYAADVFCTVANVRLIFLNTPKLL